MIGQILKVVNLAASLEKEIFGPDQFQSAFHDVQISGRASDVQNIVSGKLQVEYSKVTYLCAPCRIVGPSRVVFNINRGFSSIASSNDLLSLRSTNIRKRFRRGGSGSEKSAFGSTGRLKIVIKSEHFNGTYLLGDAIESPRLISNIDFSVSFRKSSTSLSFKHFLNLAPGIRQKLDKDLRLLD
jgi:hypothetical protein